MRLPIGPTSLDLPTWISTIGTLAVGVIAILASVWVARSDTRARRLERQADKDEVRQKYVEFIGFVSDEVDVAGRELTTLSEASTDINFLGRSDSDYKFRPTGFIKNHYGDVLNNVIGRLRRIANLPMGYWESPQIQSLFVEGLERVERDFVKLAEPARVQISPSDGDNWDRYIALVRRTKQMSDNFGRHFKTFRGFSASYLSAATWAGFEPRFPAIQKALSELQAQETRESQGRKTSPRNEYTERDLRDLEAEFDEQDRQEMARDEELKNHPNRWL